MAASATGLWIGPGRRHCAAPGGTGMALFEGFPYLVTRVIAALYHVTVLPGDASQRDLAGLARAQWRANRLDLCLVMGPQQALYIDAAGRDGLDPRPPRGGVLITGRLRPPTAWPDTANLRARQSRLAGIVGDHARKGGYMLGDITKGGREASADDVARLAGAGPEGLPRGLERCRGCGEWRGSCLDPSPQFFARVMTVHCRCANDNRCAACGGPLYQRKLNANYYEPADGRIWHVPGFSGLDHRCLPAIPPLPATPGHLPMLIGAWDIGYPGPDTMIRDDYRERLHLAADGTYTWRPAPPWARDRGGWKVFRGKDKALRLAFETQAGGLRSHFLVLMNSPGLGMAFHWQRTHADMVVFADRILRADRCSE